MGPINRYSGPILEVSHRWPRTRGRTIYTHSTLVTLNRQLHHHSKDNLGVSIYSNFPHYKHMCSWHTKQPSSCLRSNNNPLKMLHCLFFYSHSPLCMSLSVDLYTIYIYIYLFSCHHNKDEYPM